MKYIKGFDSLRAVSIIFVLISHLGLYAYLPENDFIQQRVWQLMSGGTGVRIFFTLSGFLITTILLREAHNFGKINFRNFYIRRFLRLLPPLLIFYIGLFVLTVNGYLETPYLGFVFSFFYIYNFVPTEYYTGELGHTWSLALEEQYYLIWPFIINYIRSKKKIFAIIFATLLICLMAIYAFPKIAMLSGFKSSRWFIPAVGPVLIGSFFAILVNGANNQFKRPFKSKKMAIIIGLLLYLFPLYTPFRELSFFFQSTGISLILIWIVFNQTSRITTILDHPALAYIGKISYGLYVYHGLFLRTGPSGELWIQKFPQNIILTVCIAILSYHFFEKPILKLKKNFKQIEK